MNTRHVDASPFFPVGAPLDLVFFDDRLRLRSEATRPAQEIALGLLEQAPGSWPSARAAFMSPSARLTRTLIGVWRAYANTRRTTIDADDEEAWDTLEADLAWASKSSFVRDRLSSVASERGCAEASDAIESAQRALIDELPAILHLRAYLALRNVPKTRALDWHRAQLEGWHLTASSSDDLVRVYSLYAASVMAEGLNPPAHIDESLLTMLKTGRSHSAAVIVLAWQLTSALAEAAYKSVSKETPQHHIDEMLRRAQSLADAGARTLPLHQLISFLHFITGIREMGSALTLGTAAMSFAKSSAYDPMNQEAYKALQETAQAPERLRPQIEALQRSGRARADAGAVLRVLETDVTAALSFTASPEGRKILESYESALREGLAYRLGRLGSSDVGAINAVAAAVTEIAADGWQAGPDYAAAVKDRAEQLEPRTRELPWDRLTPTLQRVVLPKGDLLALFLPDPAAPRIDALARELRESPRRVPLADSVLYQRPSLGERFQRWLFSRGDWVYKLSGALGLVIVVVVTLHSAVSWVQDFRLERAYARAAAAIEAGDDQSVVRSALTFLEIDQAEQDPRVPQMVAWLEEGMVRQVVSLVEGGDTREAERLLNRYDQLRTDLDALLDE